MRTCACGAAAGRTGCTDFWLTLLQGHPTFVFWPAHVANHHRHRHGPQDAARTYRFGGDTNHLLGYLLHPLQAVARALSDVRGLAGPAAAPLAGRVALLHGAVRAVARQLGRAARARLAEGAAVRDPAAAARPALAAGHQLPAACACGRTAAPGEARSLDYARNFEGLVNPLLFNIGLHTAHHEHPQAHWSALARLHREHYRARVDPALNERGLVPYMARVFVLGALVPRFRSRSLMPPNSHPLS